MFHHNQPFSIRTRRRAGVVVIDMEGELVLGPSLTAFRSETRAALSGNVSGNAPALMVLNMGRVPRLDSSGLGELFLLHSVATSAGAKLVLAATPTRILDLLSLTRMDGIFPSFADEHAAMGAMAATGSA